MSAARASRAIGWTARGAVLALVGVHLAVSPCARADGPDAALLKTRADVAFDNRSYAEALDGYRAALAAGGDPRIHYNIAQALTAIERYPDALVSYQRFLAEAPSGTLNAEQRETFFALLDQLKAKITRVEVTCDVAGARVLVRDSALGTTPLEGAISVNAGPAKIEVLAEGFRPYVTDIVLLGGSLQRVPVVLERIDFTGALTVKGNVPDAHVLIDGADRGTVPLTLRVERGAHTLLLKAAGYDTQSETIAMDAGGHREATFTLRRSPDYTLAYTGGGIGVAGIAVGTVTGILAFTSLGDAKAQCDAATKQCGPAGQPGLQTSATYGTLSTVFFGVGAAGLGVGVYAWFAARRGREVAAPVRVVVLPGALGLRGTFE